MDLCKVVLVLLRAMFVSKAHLAVENLALEIDYLWHRLGRPSPRHGQQDDEAEREERGPRGVVNHGDAVRG